MSSSEPHHPNSNVPEVPAGPNSTKVPSGSQSSAKLTLTVSVQDSATEINVSDHLFRSVYRGYGDTAIELPPGIYGIRARAGYAIEKQTVVLRNDPKLVEFGPIHYASPIPLAHTQTFDQSHADIALAQSIETHLTAGNGGWFFLLVRSHLPRANGLSDTHPAAGLILRTPAGKVIADFAKSSAWLARDTICAACNVQLDPGIYVLGLDVKEGFRIDQTVVVSAGWQTQFFCLRRDYGFTRPTISVGDVTESDLPDQAPADRPRIWLADIAGASILMRRDCGFDPSDRRLRMVDLLRHALAVNALAMSREQLERVLSESSDDPLALIYATHLLRRGLVAKPRALPLLRKMLGDAHPDVAAIALMDNADTGGPGPGTEHRFTVPPMLRASWRLVVDATIRWPTLVPPDSLAAKVAIKLAGAGPWATWITLSQSFHEQDFIVTIAEYLKQRWFKFDPQGETKGNDPQVIAGTSRPASSDVTLLLPRIESLINDAQLVELVQSFGVPRAAIDQLIGRSEVLFNTLSEFRDAGVDRLTRWIARAILRGDWRPFEGPMSSEVAYEVSLLLDQQGTQFKKSFTKAVSQFVTDPIVQAVVGPSGLSADPVVVQTLIQLVGIFHIDGAIPWLTNLFERQEVRDNQTGPWALSEQILGAVARVSSKAALSWINERLGDVRDAATAYVSLLKANAERFRDQYFLKTARISKDKNDIEKVTGALLDYAPEKGRVAWMEKHINQLLNTDDTDPVALSLLSRLGKGDRVETAGLSVEAACIDVSEESVPVLRLKSLEESWARDELKAISMPIKIPQKKMHWVLDAVTSSSDGRSESDNMDNIYVAKLLELDYV
ncbi:MAG: hypothetical protein M3O30_17905 [Planctomycetota bacterium]|nr:hypothetical protein [Planctomycetota bacterium]